MIPVSENSVHSQVDHLFRHNAGQMVSILCRIFGVEKIDLIEDAVQTAFVTAMKKWPFGGVPENPSAWLTQVAKNKSSRSTASRETFRRAGCDRNRPYR